MNAKMKSAPAPRSSIADPGLRRPDWVAGQPRKKELIWLDKNENLDPILGAVVRQAIIDAGLDAAAVYPDVGPLYRKLAAHVGCKPENLMMTAGSDAAIAAVFQAYVERGDIVLHTAPSFSMYEVYCRIFGAERVSVDYQRRNSGPCLDVDAMIAVIRDRSPRLVCLPNPDSPTGTVVPSEDLRRLIEAARESGAIMLIDEAYHPFHSKTVANWVDEFPNLVVIRSASKCWGLAGVRVGYMIAGIDLAQILHQVKPMYEIGAMAAAVFDRLLDRCEEMHASVDRLMDGKRAFADAMTELGFGVLLTEGSFLHVAFGAHADRIHRVLSDMVYYRPDFDHPALKGYSRFSATTRDGFAPIIDRIRTAI